MAAVDDSILDDSAMNASEVAAAIATGRATSVEVAQETLRRIEEREHEIHAFAHLDPELCHRAGYAT